MQKKFVLFLAVAFAVLSFSSMALGKDKPFVIGYCINNFNDTFQTYIVDAATEYVEKNPDLKLVTADAQEDVIKQQDAVYALIQQGVDALAVVPVDTSAMAPITKTAAEAGLPICYVNRNPYAGQDMPKNVYYVGSQEILAGIMQMEYVGKLLKGKGGVAILQGILSNEGAIKRTEGVEKMVKEKFPEVEILAEETGSWQRDQGISITENWLTTYGEKLNAVVANNDEMALGAVRALQSFGREDVLVIGIDGIPDAIAAIEEGTMVGSVLQDAVGQGEGCVKILEKVLQGKNVEPVTWVDFKLITPENVQEFK